MKTKSYPHLLGRLAQPCALEPARLEEIGALLAAGGPLPDNDEAPAPPPKWYCAGSVAVVPVSGTLLHRSAGTIAAASGLASYGDIAAGFAAALEDQQTTSLLLHIDSPGGEIAGLFNLADKIHAARGVKPLVALVDERACSAAFLLAAAADKIVLASATAEVGSVGVVALHVDQSAKDEKDGLAFSYIHAGARKIDGNPHAPLSQEAKADLQGKIDAAMGQFVRRIAAWRGLSEQAVRATEARVFAGADALSAGFADEIAAPDALLMQLNNPQHGGAHMRNLTFPGATAGPTLPQSPADDAPLTPEQLAHAAQFAGLSDPVQVAQFAASAANLPGSQVRAAVLDFKAAQSNRQKINGNFALPVSYIGGSAHNATTLDNPANRARAMGAALASRFGAGECPPEARQFAGMGMAEIASMVCGLNGIAPGGTYGGRISAAMTTSDFPLLLGEFTNRTLQSAYAVAPAALKVIANEAQANDFRRLHRLKAGEFPLLEKVNEAGEYKHGALAEGGEHYQLDTFGRIINLSRQAIVNDDLGAFADVTRRVGFACAEFEGRQLAQLLTSNPLLSDGKPVFHTDHRNIAPAGSNIAEGLGAARQALRLQTGIDGEMLVNIQPRFLVAGADREEEAERALAAVQATRTADANPYTFLQLVVDPRLTGGSWYLFGSPAMSPAIEFAYLSGQKGPTVTTENGFDTDALRVKVSLDWGCGWVDHRPAFKNPGNAA